MAYNVQIIGWRELYQGERLRYLLEQISNDLSDQLGGCTLVWRLTKWQDVCFVDSITSQGQVFSFSARYVIDDYRFFVFYRMVDIPQVVQILLGG